MWWSTILPITECVHFNFLSLLFTKKVVCIILLTEFNYSCFEICNLCSVGRFTIPKNQKGTQNGRENIFKFPLERTPGWGAMTENSFLSWLNGRALLTTDTCSNAFPFWLVIHEETLVPAKLFEWEDVWGGNPSAGAELVILVTFNVCAMPIAHVASCREKF